MTFGERERARARQRERVMQRERDRQAALPASERERLNEQRARVVAALRREA